MSVRRLAEIQPESFEFTPENREWLDAQIAKYPPGRQASAVIPALWQAQKQHDYWLPQKAIEKVADLLGMPYIRALEIATFYTMFNLAPVGKFYIQLCGTTPCMLRGADEIIRICQERIGPQGEVTSDGLFSWLEVECLGACCNAPMVQINEDYYEDLTPENFSKLLDDMAAGRQVRIGSQIGRIGSEPEGGLTSLTSLYGIDGHSGPGVEPATPAANDDSAPIDHAIEIHAAAEEAHVNAILATLPKDATPEHKANAVGARPVGLADPRGGTADDLQRLRGIGPVNEKHLHELGIYHFDQIAGWTRDEIRWVGAYLSFPGRIDREQWVTQAANLAAGGVGLHGAHAPTKA